MFECLVERGPFWQNVLQFYAAVAAPAQQIAWVQRAGQEPRAYSGIESLLKGVEYQRATLITLPEYVRFSLLQLRDSVKIALPETAWWVWVGQDWAIPIIRGLKIGEASKELLRQFQIAGLENPEKVAFALWLFPKAILPHTEEWNNFSKIVQQLLTIPEHSKAAVKAALLYNIPVDLRVVEEGVLTEACSDYPFQRDIRGSMKGEDLISRLPRGTLLQLLCFESPHSTEILGTNIWKFLSLPVEISDYTEEYQPEDGSEISCMAPNWTRIKLSQQTPLCFEAGSGEVHPVEKYVLALFDALQNPNDAGRDLVARGLEKTLPGSPSWYMTSESILGPSPNEFSSAADWIRYKNSLKEYFSNEGRVKELKPIFESLRNPTEGLRNLWCAMLFHPKYWDILVENGLISISALEKIRKLHWAEMMKIPLNFLTGIEFAGLYSTQKHFTLPLESLVEVALKVHNDGGLRDASFLAAIIRSANFSGLKTDKFHELMSRVKDISRIPDMWMQLFMGMCIHAEPFDARFTADYWVQLNGSNQRHLWALRHYLMLQPEHLHICRQDLLTLGDADSLAMAIQLTNAGRELPEVQAAELNAKITGILSKSNELSPQISSLFAGLLETPPSVNEVELYADNLRFDALRLGDYSSGLANRIQMLPPRVSRAQYPRLAELLKLFLDRSKGYPVEVSVAALNALIQIDIANREPMSEVLWQLPPQKSETACA